MNYICICLSTGTQRYCFFVVIRFAFLLLFFRSYGTLFLVKFLLIITLYCHSCIYWIYIEDHIVQTQSHYDFFYWHDDCFDIFNLLFRLYECGYSLLLFDYILFNLSKKLTKKKKRFKSKSNGKKNLMISENEYHCKEILYYFISLYCLNWNIFLEILNWYGGRLTQENAPITHYF